MEKLKNLSFTSKGLILASGIIATSIGTYLIYKKLSKRRHPEDGSLEAVSGDRLKCGRQPSENVDNSDTHEPSKKVLVLGLEKSGKTCLLAAMTNEDSLKQYQPTLGFNVICITNIEDRLDIMEIGGSKVYQQHWNRFLKDTSILVFVIDSCQIEALSSALDALKEVVAKKELERIPVVIVFSKQDHDTATPINDMIESIEKEQFGGKSFQYASVQVKCGGAPETRGVLQLQETLAQLSKT